MNESEKKLGDEYKVIYAAINEWGNRVDTLLTQILEPIKKLVKIQPKHRIKDNKSYIYKALYRKYAYTNPLEQIDDKVATRVVLLKSSDIALVEQLINQAKCWSTKVTKTMIGPIEDQPTVFDYQSYHIVVYPPSDEIINGVESTYLGCEIQIRTLLQHAFAEISHDNTYKGVYRNDKDIIRHLAKSMALMEATDDYFISVFNLMANQQRTYSIFLNELTMLYRQFNESFDKNNLNIDLNDRLLELLNHCDVKIADLEVFVQKKERDYKKAIKPKNGILFEQPVSILIGYLLYEHQSVLKEHWPLNQAALNKVYLAFGFSTGGY